MKTLNDILQSPATSQAERSTISKAIDSGYCTGNETELEMESEVQRLKWLNQYGVQGAFKDKDFADFKPELQPKAFKSCHEYQGGSMVLLSPGIYGVGKTHLVCALANQIVGQWPAAKETAWGAINRLPCPVKFISETKLLSRIRSTYNNNSQEQEDDVFRALAGHKVLIIDDVGKVRPRDYSFLQGVYFRIIDERYTNERDVILTTNLTLQELEGHLGGASSDRLREMCGKAGFIVMKGQSYRRS